LTDAVSSVKSEPIESWLVFQSNQGTDDHLRQKHIDEVQPFESVCIEGTILENPRTLTGGHVLFNLRDRTGIIPCMAYEPTKEFRGIIRGLFDGDLVIVYGAVRESPLTVNLEKIFVKKLRSVQRKTENPVCSKCGKHMKSKGAEQGYKCVRCKTTSNTPRIQEQPRIITNGFYEVPVCARRHLSKPLKRIQTHHSTNEHLIGTVDTP
jgi:tRNA(Ile2)-agmatinylcytidine synthase